MNSKLELSYIILSLSIILALFTTLRNFSAIYYILLFFLLSYQMIKKLPYFFIFDRKFILFHLWIYFTIFICGWSFLFVNNIVTYSYIPTTSLSSIINTEGTVYFSEVSINPLLGIPRLLLMPLIGFIFIHSLKNDKDYTNLIKIILYCFIFGALTILYQSYAGQISWFSSFHNRGGYVRYGSILGSLTVFGSLTGYAVLMILNNSFVKSTTIKIFFLSIIVLASFLSLTKTGLMLIICSVIFLSFSTFIVNFKKFFRLVLFFSIFLIFGYFILINNLFLLDYFNTVTNFTFGSDWIIPSESETRYISDTQVVTLELLKERVTKFAFGSLLYYGYNVFFLGVGVWGGGGIMGYADGASPHSGLMDTLIIGGPLYLFLFIYIYFKVQIFFFKNSKNNLNHFFFLSNLIFLLNMIFISGSLYQPSISIIFWLSIAYYYLQIRKEKYK